MSSPSACVDNLRRRFEAALMHDGLEHLRLEAGSLDDYARLAQFHYKTQPPGAVTAVYRFVDHGQSPVGLALQRGETSITAAVLTVSTPHPGCRMRDYATNGRYRGLDLTSSMLMLNQEFRTISRTIVHPQYRGLGLAGRLVRHALDRAETIFTEALAAMGAVHPFLERAGMQRYDQPPRPEHARLVDALEKLGVEPVELALPGRLVARLEALPRTEREWIERELRQWHRKACMKRSHKVERLELDGLLKAARDRLMTRPVYYLWCRADARDAGASRDRHHAAHCGSNQEEKETP